VSALSNLNATVAFTKLQFSATRHSGVSEASVYQVKGGQFVQFAAPSQLP
jgi:hypothetical protein